MSRTRRTSIALTAGDARITVTIPEGVSIATLKQLAQRVADMTGGRVGRLEITPKPDDIADERPTTP